MAFRSQVGGDQRLLLDLGWRLVAKGQWLPYGMPTSGGGRSPGGLMALLVGFPLYIWRDFRAPAVFTVALHAGAFLLFIRTVRFALTGAGLWLMLPLLWFNPWRIYFSAHLWNSNFMVVIAVLHLATAQWMRASRAAWATFLHALVIGLAIQIHMSAATLAILSLLLYWRRMIRVHWGGLALAIVLTIVALAPGVVAVINEPNLAPGSRGFLLRGLVFVFPFLRGLVYWVKLSSLSLASRMLDFDFTPVLGRSANMVLVPFGVVLGLLAHVTVAPSIWANWRFARKMWRIRNWRCAPERPRAWLRAYVALTLAAALLSFAISPSTVMFWQEFVVLPAAILVMVTTTEGLLRTQHRRQVVRAIRVWCWLLTALLAFEAFGAPAYRCGGWDPGPRDPMLVDLRVPATCD